MAESPHSSGLGHDLAHLQVRLHRGLQIFSRSGHELQPNARKAKAMLAILCVSGDNPVPRQYVAGLLWSSSENSTRLARLRDVIYDLRTLTSHCGIDIVDVSRHGLSLRSEMVAVYFGNSERATSQSEMAWSTFLIDLEGIDPAFDRWLISFRLGQQQARVNTAASDKIAMSREPGYAPNTLAVTLPITQGLEIEGAGAVARALFGEVNNALARLRWFKIVTRNVRGQTLNVGDEDLSEIAGYALLSNLIGDQDHRQLYVELIALGKTGKLEWAHSYNLERNATALECKNVAERISVRVDTELLLAETAREQHEATSTSGDAYALTLRALPAIFQLERDRFMGAGFLLEQAVGADVKSAFARSWLAYWYIFLVGQGWASQPAQAMTKAERAVDEAMLLDPKDARAFTIAGHVKAFIGKRLDEAEALHNVALQLNPSLALAWHLAGMTSAYAGRLDEAHTRLCRCQSLSLSDPTAFFSEGALSIVHLLRHQHQESAVIGQRVTQRHPNFTSAYKSTIAALSHLGEISEASRLARRLRTLEPHFTLRGFQATAPYRRRQDLNHFVSGLRLAGLT